MHLRQSKKSIFEDIFAGRGESWRVGVVNEKILVTAMDHTDILRELRCKASPFCLTSE